MKKTVINALFAVTIVGLVSAIAVAVTWALRKPLNQKTNTFTSDNDITAALSEPWWEFKDVDGNTVNPTSVGYPTEAILGSATATPETGLSRATGYTLGKKIPKNPIVNNTSDEKSEWLGIRVVYKLTFDKSKVFTDEHGDNNPSSDNAAIVTVDYANFSKLATVKLVSGNALTGSFRTATTPAAGDGKWSPQAAVAGKMAANEVFYYDNIVDSGDATAALFDAVQINTTLTIASGATYCAMSGTDATGASTTIYFDGNALPSIDIELQGFAVDATNLSPENAANMSTAHSALKDLVLATCYPASGS